MNFIVLLNLIIALLSASVIFITRAIVWRRVLEVNRNQIREMTLVAFLKKYHFNPKESIDREMLNQLINEINDNDFGHVLDDLTQQAKVVLDTQVSQAEQQKRYQKMVATFNIIKKRFKKSMTRGELFIFDLRRVASLTLAFALLMLLSNYIWIQQSGIIFNYRGVFLGACGCILIGLMMVIVFFLIEMVKNLIY
ncbi:hypothetical protein D3P96_02025 [Weissella viridescens]|uniref:Uncharacterized protein n=1 Tax=Weissella viridescens TaxID=1629 RepID=A0A3P2RDS8_WEIVI|nr:hypothetical protein [Weissella viridescens]RRG18784.1 hypothetical protein D3P96_02025 [Weissella viridescens]